MASGQVRKTFLEGWPRKFSAGVNELVKKPSTVLLYCSIVLQHMHKLALGYAGYKKKLNAYFSCMFYISPVTMCIAVLSKFCQS